MSAHRGPRRRWLTSTRVVSYTSPTGLHVEVTGCKVDDAIQLIELARDLDTRRPLTQAEIDIADEAFERSQQRAARAGAEAAAYVFDPPEYDVETNGPVLPEWLTWPWVLVLVVFTVGIVMIVAGELS